MLSYLEGDISSAVAEDKADMTDACKFVAFHYGQMSTASVYIQNYSQDCDQCDHKGYPWVIAY